MVNMKTNKWWIILVLIILGLIIYLITRPERKFEQYQFKQHNLVLNAAEPSYLDTIVQVGLDKMSIQGVVVVIRNQTEAQSLGGDYETEAYLRTNGDQYEIRVKSSIGRAKAISILAHELIHLQQYETDLLKNLGGKAVIWKGDTIPDITTIDYMKRGWEEDAFKHGPNLAKEIKSVLWASE